MDAIFDDGPAPPCPAPFNLAAHVLSCAARTPDKVALAVIGLTGADRWSFGRLEAAVRGTATGLTRLGLGPGDRVLMRIGNTVDFPIAFLGALAADLVPVPTSALLTTPEITGIARDLAPRLILAQPGVALPEPAPCPVLDTAALAEMRDLPPADYVLGDPDRPGYVIYTSGTSGSPRAVLHAHRAIWARRMMWDGWYGLRDTDRLLHAGAFNWTYTLGTGLLDPWSVGATALIPDADVLPTQIPLLMKRHDATIFAAAPGVYRQMLRGDMPALPRLRHGLSAGEKLPDITRARWETLTGTGMYEAFGMSECSTFVSGTPTRPAPPGALGYPQPGRRVAVLDGTRIARRNTPGTLAVSTRDPGLMLRYLNAPEATAERFSGEWFLTGDSVVMGDDGALTYLGRTDDMMNAGGVRVSPIEVEHAMNTHPAILESAVAELRLKADTSVIGCFYVADQDIDETELSVFAADRLARYKCPRVFRRVEALPKGGNGKLLRRALRQTWESDHGQA